MSTGIGVDIGGSHIVCCGVDLRSHALLDDTRFERKLNRKGSKEEVFQAWADTINQTVSALEGDSIRGVGFAMPGAFDYKKGIALFEGNDKYENLYQVDVGREFPAYLALENPTIRFMNDATAFGVGTAYLEENAVTEKLIAVTLGTGFGSTFIDKGVPQMEVEVVPPYGSLWHLPFNGGIADEYFSTRWFINTYRERTGYRAAGVKEIAERASAADDARTLFVDFGANLATFLMPWMERFEADRLVVGGNIARAWSLMEPSFLATLDGKLPDLRIQPSALMEEAAIVGSARTLEDSFWNLIKEELPTV